MLLRCPLILLTTHLTLLALATTHDRLQVQPTDSLLNGHGAHGLEPLQGPVPVPRIYSGDRVTAGELPFVVQIVMTGGGGTRYTCGGSILSAEWAITAAHCVLDSVTFSSTTTYLVTHGALVEVIAGDSYKKDTEGTEQSATVQQIFVHESYDNTDLQNDIALLRLAEPLILANAVDAIPLGTVKPATGQTVTVAGWGTLNSGQLSYYLIKAVYGVPSNEQCKAAYTESFPILPGMWCTGDYDMTKHSATGDSGGPIFVKDGNNFALYGLVSWGPGNEDVGLGQYDVNTDIAYYKDWITGIQNNYVQYMQTLTATSANVTIEWSSKNDRYRYQSYYITSQQFVQVDFPKFEFRDRADSVTLYDGSSVSSPIIVQLRYTADHSASTTYTSSSSSLFVLIRSNGNWRTKSLTMTYRTVDNPSAKVYNCGTVKAKCGTSGPYCEAGYSLCSSKDQCYPDIARCDNSTDCIDGSDEPCSGSYSLSYSILVLMALISLHEPSYFV